MKRKRIEKNSKKKKRIKRDFFLFLHAFESNKQPKQRIMVYDPIKHIILFKELEFLNWFYFYSPKKYVEILKYFKNSKNCGITLIEQIDNVKQTVGVDLSTVFKVECHEPAKQDIINNIYRIDGKCQLFEANIPRSIRFITYNNLRFLEKICFSKKLKKLKNEIFEIPIWVYTSKNKTKFWRIYQINEKYELVYDAKFESLFLPNKNQENKIIVCWDVLEDLRNSYSFNDKLIPNCFILYFKSFCLSFLRIKETLRVDKMKIASHNYYLLNTKEYQQLRQLQQRFDVMCEVFSTYFQQALFLTKELCIPMRFVFTIPNRKVISDFIFLSNKKKILILGSPPRNLQPYCSNPLQNIYSKERFITSKKKIFSLDFSGMYPSIMLEIFKNNPKLLPYIEMIKRFKALKNAETDIKKRSVYKLLLLTTYGCFGIHNLRGQYLLCSDTVIAKNICKNARILLEKTINHFSNLGFEVLYCNTDNLVIKGESEEVKKRLGEWNAKHNGVFVLKIEREGTKLIIFNKQVRAWFNDGNLEIIGNFFNSVKVCPVVRKFLHEIILDAMNHSNTMKEFKTNFSIYSKKKIEIARNYKITSLFELVETRKFKKNRSLVDEGLEFFLPLYSGFGGGDSMDGKFGLAKTLVDGNHQNFRIDKRLENYTKKVEDLINKIL